MRQPPVRRERLRQNQPDLQLRYGAVHHLHPVGLLQRQQQVRGLPKQRRDMRERGVPAGNGFT